LEIKVVSGDIAQVKADALITAINMSGMWWGGIDDVIQRVAGNLFHNQAARKMPLTEGQVVIAYGSINKGLFTNVVFVVDELSKPLRRVVYAGLKAANEAGFKSVSLPTIRMGVMLGKVEKTKEKAVAEMVAGVELFKANRGNNASLEEITFVVYNNTQTEALLRQGFNL